MKQAMKETGKNMNSGSELIRRLLASEIKGDLLVLFHKNPGLIDTIDGIALRIGRKGKSIDNDVKDLVDIGLLRSKRIGGFEVINLDPKRDEEIQGIVADYLNGLKKNRRN